MRDQVARDVIAAGAERSDYRMVAGDAMTIHIPDDLARELRDMAAAQQGRSRPDLSTLPASYFTRCVDLARTLWDGFALECVPQPLAGRFVRSVRH
jgi:hypothetical protein